MALKSSITVFTSILYMGVNQMRARGFNAKKSENSHHVDSQEKKKNCTIFFVLYSAAIIIPWKNPPATDNGSSCLCLLPVTARQLR